MNRFTPGPWRCKFPYIWKENNHGSHRLHLTFSSNVWADDGGYTSEEEKKATAQLIVTSLRLYNDMVVIADQMQSLIDSGKAAKVFPWAISIKKIAEEAIACAEGK